MAVTLQQLRYFLAVADVRSFTRPAELQERWFALLTSLYLRVFTACIAAMRY
jgi:hypothetical protein